MGMFTMRKPRGFHHSYIYVDERKEKLAKMTEDAKRDLGMLPEKEFSPEDIRLAVAKKNSKESKSQVIEQTLF